MVQFPEDSRFDEWRAREMKRDQEKWGSGASPSAAATTTDHCRRWIDPQTGTVVIAGTPDTDLL